MARDTMARVYLYPPSHVYIQDKLHIIIVMLIQNASFYIPIDINECELELDNCSPNAACTNTIGSFECECLSGFSGDGMTCEGQ